MVDLFWAAWCLSLAACAGTILALDWRLYLAERRHAREEGRRRALAGLGDEHCPYREEGLRRAWLEGHAVGLDERG